MYAIFSPVRGDEIKMPEKHPSCLTVNERENRRLSSLKKQFFLAKLAYSGNYSTDKYFLCVK
jgi:hypothetical protein